MGAARFQHRGGDGGCRVPQRVGGEVEQRQSRRGSCQRREQQAGATIDAAASQREVCQPTGGEDTHQRFEPAAAEAVVPPPVQQAAAEVQRGEAAAAVSALRRSQAAGERRQARNADSVVPQRQRRGHRGYR